MHSLIGVKDVAIHLFPPLLNRRRRREEGKSFGIWIPLLHGQSRNIDRRNVDTRGSAGLHPSSPDSLFFKLAGQTIRAVLPYPAAFE